MSQDYRNGKIVNNLFYIGGALLLMVYVLFDRELNLFWRIGLFISQAVSAGWLFFYGRKKEGYRKVFRIVQIICLVAQSYLLCCTITNSQIFIYLMLQCLSILIYLEYKLCRFHLLLSVLLLVPSIILKFPGFKSPLTRSEAVFGFFCLVVMEWLAMNVTKSYAFRYQENIEKERSLDDMLKLVEVKCEDALQATRSKSDFLSNMSHEIRTPINSILGMNEMILRECKDEEILNYAATVEQSGRLLLALINEILDLSKIESGKMEIVPVEYQMSSILNDVVNMIKERAEKKDLELEIEANAKIPNHLYGDEIRIRQVLTNLLTNAVKYTKAGTVTLAVDFERIGENSLNLKVGVKDTGIGIKEEDIEHLFDSFQRLDQVNNRHIEGTGLGLAITSRLVDMMEGTLKVESEYGKGSFFSVTIPQQILDSEEMGDFKKKFLESTRERKEYQKSFLAPEAKILVVDDNEMNLQVVKALLKETQVQITLCQSGQECLKQLRKQEFDVILLDHMMPTMDGIETLRYIRAIQVPDCSKIPVIALTANAISGVRTMYVQAGFDDYLSKPIVGAALEEMLLKYIPAEKIKAQEAADAQETVAAQETVEQNETVEMAETISEEKEKNVPGTYLNVKSGLTYSGDSEEIYSEFLQMFCDMKEEKETALQAAFENRDWAQYTILIHALKSNAASIGGEVLAEQARQLEMAGKAEGGQTVEETAQIQAGASFILEHHEKTMELYAQTVAEGQAWLQEH